MANGARHWLSRPDRVSALSRWTGLVCNGLTVAILIVLIAAYAISDRHWLGAAWGIWPAWFWSPGLVVLAVLGYRPGGGRVTLALLAAIALFCVAFSEAWFVFRRPDVDARRVFQKVHEARIANSGADGRDDTPSTRSFPLRVISWNLNGLPAGPGQSLAELARYRPDLCFVQEVWSGESELPRAAIDAHLPGYQWIVEPDCGLLSRYPATELRPLELDGPHRALVAQVRLPDAARLTCICVHLPLLPLRLGIHKRSVRQETRAAVAQRRRMMARFVKPARNHLELGPVIVAGDWNVPASAGSLTPLRAVLRDAFLYGGAGWGNTMTNEFPVSRIDAVFVSTEFAVVYCGAHAATASDHRLVEAELWLRGRGGEKIEERG